MANAVSPLVEHVTSNSILLVDEARADFFQSCLQYVVKHEHAEAMLNSVVNPKAGDDDDFWPADPDSWQARLRPYHVDDEGTLQIPVMGVLLHRFGYQLGRWATGYKYIEMALKRGLEDVTVKRIALLVDSPGGEVAGCFELADDIYEARGQKNIRAFASDHMYSAAYALGSSTSGVSVTRSGGVGSVGVVTAHVEYSEMLESMGIKVTLLKKGKHKTDGNPYEKLSRQARDRIDARLEKHYSVFVSTVARNRGMDEQAVRDTEALTYDADDSLTVGFADRVGTLEDEMAIFAEEPLIGDEQMADIKKEDHDKAVAAARTEGHAAGVEEGKAAGREEGEAAAKTRINTILGSDEAKDRPKAAYNCAMKTSMSVEEAKEFLADMPKEGKPAAATDTDKPGAKAGQTPFEAAMAEGNPEVGADPSAQAGGEGEVDQAASILADYGQAAGAIKKSGKAA